MNARNRVAEAHADPTSQVRQSNRNLGLYFTTHLPPSVQPVQSLRVRGIV